MEDMITRVVSSGLVSQSGAVPVGPPDVEEVKPVWLWRCTGWGLMPLRPRLLVAIRDASKSAFREVCLGALGEKRGRGRRDTDEAWWRP